MKPSVNASLWVLMNRNLFKIPRLLGDINDRDTQFTALVKKYQHLLFIMAGAVIILMVFLTALTFTATPKGTWRYGLCHVFLERYSQYPTNLRILVAGERQTSAQIGYLTTNAYGSQVSQLMECFYSIEATGVKINRITIDRVPLAQSFIDDFNPTIPAILGREDLHYELPPRLPNDLKDLKQE